MPRLAKQRLLGLLMVVLSVGMVLLASLGETPEERDATVVVITLPMGLYVMITKDNVFDFYDGPRPRRRKQNFVSIAPNPLPMQAIIRTARTKGVSSWHANAS